MSLDQLKTEDVTLESLDITIKAIRIGKKQMSISVFKQLPERGYYKNNGNLIPGADYLGFVKHKIYITPRDLDPIEYWVVMGYKGILYRCSYIGGKNIPPVLDAQEYHLDAIVFADEYRNWIEECDRYESDPVNTEYIEEMKSGQSFLRDPYESIPSESRRFFDYKDKDTLDRSLRLKVLTKIDVETGHYLEKIDHSKDFVSTMKFIDSLPQVFIST